MDRRIFLEFMGRAGLLAIAGCALPQHKSSDGAKKINLKYAPFAPLAATSEDDLILADGFEYHKLISWREPINSRGDLFGSHCDYLCYLPFSQADLSKGYLWVNHEYFDPEIMYGYKPGDSKTKAQVALEQREVGGSILHIQKSKNGKWSVVIDDQINYRFDANTEIALSHPIYGAKKTFGTMANCAGGFTPWGTVLTCEENIDQFVGDVTYDENNKRILLPSDSKRSWTMHDIRSPEHYGWVVEIDVKTKKATKQIALGRFAHESATVAQLQDGRVVVYMGDDADDQYFYKFIASQPNSLKDGTLYVANLERGEWLALDVEKNINLKNKFKSQIQMLIRTPEAAKMLGATPLDRPEDCEIDPITKSIFVNCTNNKKRGRPFGSILKITEDNNDFASLKFKSEVFISGGEKSGIACPDNMVFDKKGNIWLTTDISDKDIADGIFKFHGNNSLFYIPMSGENAGHAFRVASAPKGAELTGPFLSPDDSTLFLSVQHPYGQWPKNESVPKSTVVAIQGSRLEKLLK